MPDLASSSRCHGNQTALKRLHATNDSSCHRRPSLSSPPYFSSFSFSVCPRSRRFSFSSATSFLLVCLSFIFLSSNYFYAVANAETLLRPEIEGQVTLKASLSPYIAYDNVVVKKNANLTIEPGCELRFAKARQLIVHGTLTARGTYSNRITFTKLNPAADSTGPPQQQRLYNNNQYRLVEGETILDGKLQVFYNAKWHYVCSTQFK